MSLTTDDLSDIRSVMLDALDAVVNPRFDRIEAQLDEHTKILDEHTKILKEHGQVLHEHTSILREHDSRLASIEKKVDNMDGRLRAIEADIKELYKSTSALPIVSFDKKFASLPPEQQITKMYYAITALAKQMHVEL